ncbi:hypothetical protein SUGI_1046390 [Cryptomeria japonica]|nr:hypothetical protein SUGI_1046390 [Cryptomeria japonica]
MGLNARRWVSRSLSRVGLEATQDAMREKREIKAKNECRGPLSLSRVMPRSFTRVLRGIDSRTIQKAHVPARSIQPKVNYCPRYAMNAGSHELKDFVNPMQSHLHHFGHT